MSRAYLLVLGAALCCYAALGAVLRLLHDLDLGPATLGVAAGAPALAAVATRPLGGRLADRRGPARVLAAGAATMAVAAPLALARGTGPLIASRMAVGAGEGLMMSAAVAWLLVLAGPGRQGRALGHIGLANYGGLTLGPLMAEGLGSPRAVIAASALLPLAALGIAAGLRDPAPAAGGAGSAAGRTTPPPAPPPPPPLRDVAAAALRPGLGLLLVNVGYAGLVAFGTPAARAHGAAAGTAGLLLPVFAATVLLARTAGASVPDRLGASRTLMSCAPASALGLLLVATASGAPLLVAGAAVLGAGQALAVPALGLLVLAEVPDGARGAAAGAFFAFFDLGVGLGGTGLGLVARAGGAPAAMVTAAAAVLLVPAVSRPLRRSTRRSGARA
jgi:MFS family permease